MKLAVGGNTKKLNKKQIFSLNIYILDFSGLIFLKRTEIIKIRLDKTATKLIK
jgi:hypothetical protein